MRLGSECHAKRSFLLPAQRPQEHKHRYIGHHDEQHEGSGDSDADQNRTHLANIVRVNRFQSDSPPAGGNLRSDTPHGFGDPPRREGGRHALTQAHHVGRARGREGQGRVGGIADIVADVAEAGRQDADDAIFLGRFAGGRGTDANGLSEDARTGAEALSPEEVADHDNALAARAEIVGRKNAAQRGADADGFEGAGGAFQ